MKKNARSGRRKPVSFLGILLFFGLVAAILQVSVLIYDYIQDRTDDVGMIAILMLFVIIILASILTLIDAWRRRVMIDRPVARILEATEQIASGDFSVRLVPDHPYGKYTEFDAIMDDLNTLAAELGKSELLKSDFISNISHELRTPLSVISAYAARLADPQLPEEERKRCAEVLAATARRLSTLITNILQLNKLENQETRVPTVEFDLSELAAEIIIGFDEIIERKQLALSCELAEEVRICSVPAYIELILANLLSNAIKFTEAGGEVAVSLSESEDEVQLTVRDTGCGISPEVGARIFEKFYQADSSRASEGNGLGLALVKRAIDRIGGEIRVESAEGQGSCFTVRLRKDPNEA